MRKTWTSLQAIQAGCFECNGDMAMWFARNSQAVAALHHDKTGHATWCEFSRGVYYGRPPAEWNREER